MQKLKIHENGRYLSFADGTPFFYLADTAWDLFFRLSPEETEEYLRIRSEQGFNTVQAILLGGILDSSTPNIYGRRPLKQLKNGFCRLDCPDLDGSDNYWEYVKTVIRCASKYGIYMALLPSWVNKYSEEMLFSEEKAYQYGAFLGDYFSDLLNIIWVIGGDYHPGHGTDHTPYIEAIAKGIRENDRGNHLIAYHPAGGHTSCDPHLKNRQLIDINGTQSSHAFGGYRSYELLRAMREFEQKPFMDVEARYENHGACWKYYNYKFDAADIRQTIYQNIMEGACGQTYGHASIFAFSNPPDDPGSYGFYLEDMPEPGWKEALFAEAAGQMKHLKNLRLSRPYYELCAAPELVNTNDDILYGHISAARGTQYAFIYLPLGQSVTVHLSLLNGKAILASWYDPRTGTEEPFSLLPSEDALFVPPSQGKGHDWVLILDVID